MERLSKKMLNFAPSFPVGGWRHEESYHALTRQKIWKIHAYGREAEMAVPPAAIYTPPLITSGEASVYTCRCELISILAYAGIPEPSDREC